MEANNEIDVLNYYIISKKAVEKLKPCFTEKIQLTPVKIINTKTSEIDNSYFLIDFLEEYDVLNHYFSERGSCTKYFSIIRKEIFNHNKVKVDIFKNKHNSLSLLMFVSNKFRNIVIKEKLTGFAFENVPTIL